ncbi:MAG: TIGR00730 family Rossman fold protein [Bacteroidales bacterium]|nr:TIGR00730 family Rossman fold protein [Bacteroidales bacterium]
MAGKALLIFCSSSSDIDPAYNEAARDVVRTAAAAGYSIVYGGAVSGTMGVVAEEASKCGIGNVGVIPRFMSDRLSPGLTSTVWTDTMSERKGKMREAGPDICIALPGGIGTMDEFFETYTLAKLGKYHGKVVVYNCKGYYDGLQELLDHFTGERMLPENDRNMVHFISTPEELKALL